MSSELAIGYPVLNVSKSFLFQEVLGSGAFGVVFKAKSVLDETLYALKRLKVEISDPHSVDKKLKEVRLLAKLRHDCVIRYFYAWLEKQSINALRESDSSVLPHEASTSTRSAFEKQWNQNVNAADLNYQQFPSQAGLQAIEQGAEQLALSSKETEKSSFELNIVDPFEEAEHPNQRARVNEESETVLLLYIQLELCDQTLMKWLNDNIDRQRDVESDLIRQVVQGVEYIHSQGFVHVDLKTNNVLLKCGAGSSGQLRCVISDFGIARSMSLKREVVAAESVDLGIPDRTAQLNEPACDCDSGEIESKVVSEKLCSSTSTTSDKEREALKEAQRSDLKDLGLIVLQIRHHYKSENERRTLLRNAQENRLPQSVSLTDAKLINLMLSNEPLTATDILNHQALCS